VPDDVDAAPNRHDAFAAIRGVSSKCAIRTKSGHAFYIVSVIGCKNFFAVVEKSAVFVFISLLPWG
jgi:hypothetical protein